MLKRCLGIAIWGLLAACASTGNPPGGPPDAKPPAIARVTPDSGVILTVPPNEAAVYFDEVIAERTAGQPPEIAGAVLLSPVEGEVRVGWHRDHITVRPRNGFVAGRIYHLEVLPVITDLRTNKLRAGRTIVFSTGPEIPHAAVQGAVVDWVAGRAAVRALVEAVLLPDSLTYRALTDSAGYFHMGQLPPGQYLVRGVMDTNNDRRLGNREAFDSMTVTLDSTSAVELFAFAHDTTGPRSRQAEVVDSVTIKLTFDRPLDSRVNLDTNTVTVATLDDSTTTLALVGVYTQRAIDSLRTHAADSAAAAKAHADSLAAAADTTPRRPAAPAARPAAPPPQIRPAGAGGRPPLDSTRADKMIARRPAPSDVRIVKLAQPMIPETRYVIHVNGARSLSGNDTTARFQVRAPRPPRATSRPTAPADSAAADTTRPRIDSTTAPARPVRP